MTKITKNSLKDLLMMTMRCWKSLILCYIIRNRLRRQQLRRRRLPPPQLLPQVSPCLAWWPKAHDGPMASDVPQSPDCPKARVMARWSKINDKYIISLQKQQKSHLLLQHLLHLQRLQRFRHWKQQLMLI